MSLSQFAQPAQAPPSALGRYRILSPRAGIRVSPLIFGGASIGDKWVPYGYNGTDKPSAFTLLDAYYDMGGNFIDTANNYQDELSEEYIGEWAEKRGIRDQLVIATKYTSGFKRGDDGVVQKVNYLGNNAKSMNISVNASLKKLRTNYIDILYVHWWDYATSVEEVMDSLHNLVVQGKVLYLGISDTPAWVVSKANQYARDHGKTPFCIYQGCWNIMERSFEREVIPMARAEGMALAPWSVLAGGRLRTDEEEELRRQTGEKGRSWAGDWERNEDEKKISHALEKVGKELGGKHISAVAIAYVMQKTPYVFPLLGARKIEQLTSNLEALDVSLSAAQISYLEGILPFDIGFPGSMIGTGVADTWLVTSAAVVDLVPVQQAIRPSQQTKGGAEVTAEGPK